MTRKQLLAISFFINLSLLASFCVVFAMPFISQMVASEIMEMAGCSPGTFDRLASCPEGSWAERFAPLSDWVSVFFAPIFFVLMFWDLVFVWALITVALGFFAFWRSAWEIFAPELWPGVALGGGAITLWTGFLVGAVSGGALLCSPTCYWSICLRNIVWRLTQYCYVSCLHRTPVLIFSW